MQNKFINNYLEEINKENFLSVNKKQKFSNTLYQFWQFIEQKNFDELKMNNFLNVANIFLIDKFIQWCKINNQGFNREISYRLEKVKDMIWKREVIARDYDERIELQSLQFQIDNYYIPKEEATKRKIKIVLKYLNPQPDEKILDVGCGVGTFAYHSAKKGAQCWGIDYSEKSIEVAKYLTNYFGVSDRVEFIVGDATNKLPYADNFFDKIVAADFIEHITDKQKSSFFNEMLRVLKPAGIAVIFTPNEFREIIGALKCKVEMLWKSSPISEETRLHFGLTNKFKIKRLLKKKNVRYYITYEDVNIPLLANIPFLKSILCLNLCIVIKKK